MTTTIVIIILVAIIFARNGKKKAKAKKYIYKTHVPQNQNRAIDEKQDESIVDVTGDSEWIVPSINFENNSQPSYQFPSYNNEIYDPNEYRLGKKYKDKLNLSPQEVTWLNKFWNPNNVFLGIEGCCTETIKLYVATLKELNKQLKKRDSTIAKEVQFLQTEIIKSYQKGYGSYWGYDSSYFKEKVESDVFLTLFKRVESMVREVFGHKRKISRDFPYSEEGVVQEFENRLGVVTEQIIQTLIPTLTIPDEETEMELNTQNVNRWKIKFEELQKNFAESKKKEFIEGIYALEKLNQKNPSIENIFFEASKFISKADNLQALRFYLHYLYYDLKSERVDNKQLAKTIQKNLFKTNEQLHHFDQIVARLIKTKNLNEALEEVYTFYQPKRKKIQLDISTIEDVQQQDKGTVALLTEYLKDDFEDESTIIKVEEINSEELQIEIGTKEKMKKGSSFVEGISLNDTQENLILWIVEQSFTVSDSELDLYCKSKGAFKNQLLDSINEHCYDVLDDILIEEDGDNYSMNENYYKKILGND